MSSSKKYSISTFPKDDKERVIWWYGGIETNPTGSNTPIVNVATKLLEEGIICDNVEVFKVSLPELDIVRLGKIFRGQEATNKIFTAYSKEYLSSILFRFDFSLFEPESIHFNDKKPGSNFFHIAPFEYDLGTFEDSMKKYQFFHSTLTKLITDEWMIVLIPSLEFLTSAIAPGHKLIRAGLFQYDLDNLLEKYVKNAEQIEDNTYQVELFENRENMNTVLLAYLSLNPTSRQRISELRASCQEEKINPKTQEIYPERYPHVLPFHPDKLAFKCDGIQLNANTFLVLRIYKISLPKNYEILKILIEDELKTPINIPPEGEDTPAIYPLNRSINGTSITIDLPPHTRAGSAYVESEVTALEDEVPNITSLRRPRTTPKPNHTTVGIDIETKYLSSGEKSNRNDSKETGSLLQKGSNKPKTSQPHDLADIENALNILCEDSHSSLSKFVYIDRDANELLDSTYCNITKEELLDDYSGFWHKIYRLYNIDLPEPIERNFLLVKLILRNGKCAYLLEIQKNNTKRYSGLFFNLSSELTAFKLQKLLSKIVIYEGQYKVRQNEGDKLLPLPLPVESCMTFKHFDDTDASVYLNRAINRAIYENIFF